MAKMTPCAVVVPGHVRGCLFDMDGVLTRTAELHAAAWKRLFDEFLEADALVGADRSPFTPSDYDRYVDGRLRADGARSFLAARGVTVPEGTPDDAADVESLHGLGARKDAYFHELLHTRGVVRDETSVAFVEAARARGLGSAVVSASRNCREVLHAAGIIDLFDAIIDGVVSGELGLRGKPAPDTFLEAARRLGVAAKHAAVFEDATVGVAAGRAGGFGWVVGVDRSGERSALLEAGADTVVDDLSALEVGP
jgi:beta-phosphoglucomutase family hydrolase